MNLATYPENLLGTRIPDAVQNSQLTDKNYFYTPINFSLLFGTTGVPLTRIEFTGYQMDNLLRYNGYLTNK